MAPDPGDIKASITSMGRHVNWRTIARTYLMYANRYPETHLSGVRVEKDLTYGPHPRHRLDIYCADEENSSARPVLVYVHGGGFVQGDKCRESNVGYYFARHGLLTLSVNYRLAPEVQWPAGAQDLTLVKEWIETNAESWGGDIARVFFLGHSAGAAHVATLLFCEGYRQDRECGEHGEFGGRRGCSVKGGILLSGPAYDTGCLNPQKDYVYYGNDLERHESMSIVRHINSACRITVPAVFIGYAEFDPPEIKYQALALADALQAHTGTRVLVKRVPGHNHISEIMHLNSAEELLGPDILDFMRSG